MGLSQKKARIEELRALVPYALQVSPQPEKAPPGPLEKTRLERTPHTTLPSGWEAVDRALPSGGLAPGQSALVSGPPGAGNLALVSSWARVAAEQGEPVVVLDPRGTALPHAWVEPEGATAPIWVLHPKTTPEVWPALDIALRSGAFGLVVLLEPGKGPVGVSSRLRMLLKDRGARLLVTGEAPMRPTATVRLKVAALRWWEAPVGFAPSERLLSVSCDAHGNTSISTSIGSDGRAGDEVRLHDLGTDRLRLAPRAPDRRPSSGKAGSARRQYGPGARRR